MTLLPGDLVAPAYQCGAVLYPRCAMSNVGSFVSHGNVGMVLACDPDPTWHRGSPWVLVLAVGNIGWGYVGTGWRALGPR